MKPCCLFSTRSANYAINNRDFVFLKNYGEAYYDSDGKLVHYNHVWDEGIRLLFQCHNCGAYFIYQQSEYHGSSKDCCYEDYFQVESEALADKYNAELNGLQMESKLRYGPRIWGTDGDFVWNKGKAVIYQTPTQ